MKPQKQHGNYWKEIHMKEFGHTLFPNSIFCPKIPLDEKSQILGAFMCQNLLFEQKLDFSRLCFWVCFAVSSSIHLHKVWPLDPWIPSSKWDFLLISYLASSNFIYILISSYVTFKIQILIFQSRGLRD